MELLGAIGLLLLTSTVLWAWLGTLRDKHPVLDKLMDLEERRCAATRKGLGALGKAAFFVGKAAIKK
ncbi:hypothetical protein [Paludisphaera rhizosphaerae]|uniref:hypothetical protein n=1 Tax=Paludisphaera rhizosphaerae TaxID=2711216 RepID=UPI0013EAB12F|nr:hypothetical protein [Paludisphaera rhizosphaerae]